MANEEALGPRKTMFVLVIVVGCFAVLWPRILYPLIIGHQRQQLQPNQFDRDAGCCEVIFETEVAILELLNEVCNAFGPTGVKISPYAAAECRKAVNETCGVDIQAFLKRSDNVGRTTKALLETMKASNSSCLKEHFGVPIWSLSIHPAINSWMFNQTVKQERATPRGLGPHPALRERGRAIPAGAPPPRPTPLPPHVRVWHTSPLSVYFDIDIKPPPIPGMRPPLGAPGGPVQAPKSSMGFVMPIYTICIIVFFVYTLSKLLFKRTGTPYEHVSPDPQFRRRVFRDDSRSSPDKLVVTAISGLVAEVQQQMEASYARNQQAQETQDNHARSYTNGTVLHSGPVQIVASQYRDPSKERTPDPVEPPATWEPDLGARDQDLERQPEETREWSPEKERDSKERLSEQEPSPYYRAPTPEAKEPSPEPKAHPKAREPTPDSKEISPEPEDLVEEEEELDPTEALIKLTKKVEEKTDNIAKMTGDFLREEAEKLRLSSERSVEEQFTDLLEEAMKEDSPVKDEEDELDNGSVKVVGMEMRAHTTDGGAWPRSETPVAAAPQTPSHEASQVQSIFLDADIPTQSRVLVADCAAGRADKPPTTKHSSLVVSGKMTLSLIPDPPRDTPERETESTFDDFTTASAYTQPAAQEKDELSDDDIQEKEDEMSDEDVEVEEVEIEEIEEEEEEEEEPEKKEETAKEDQPKNKEYN